MTSIVAAPTEFKRLCIRGFKWDAEDSGLSLKATLKVACRARLTETATGAVLVGTTANGHSVTLSLPAAGRGVTPHEMAALTEELYSLLERVESALVSAGTPSPTDDQILTEMIDRLQAVRSTAPTSFVGLRYS